VLARVLAEQLLAGIGDIAQNSFPGISRWPILPTLEGQVTGETQANRDAAAEAAAVKGSVLARGRWALARKPLATRGGASSAFS
jgi:hypothetical protein